MVIEDLELFSKLHVTSAIRLIQLQPKRLARVSYHDPHVPQLETLHLEKPLHSVKLSTEVVSSSDAMIIVTDHSTINYAMILDHATLVVDTRNATVAYRNPSSRL